jgi:hypothetical protein
MATNVTGLIHTRQGDAIWLTDREFPDLGITKK